jgi:molybdenum cofactor cytidylyltransferase
MTTGEENLPRVAAVILAAGGSERMGRPKQLMPVRGKPMVRCVTETVCTSGMAQVIIVVGAVADRVAQAVSGLPVEIVVNMAWSQGLSTSVRAGLGAIVASIEAAMIVLADQPRLTRRTLQALVARYAATRALIVAPYHRGRRGNPVLFDRALFHELLAVEGDQGGRAVVARHEHAVARLEVDDPATALDVDTPQDYRKLAKLRSNDEQRD